VDGDLVVTTDGEVVSGKNVNGCIVVKAVGVTVENSKAQCVAMEDRARDPANPRLTVQDVEIDCRNGAGSGGNTGIGDRNFNVYRANIHNCENGFDADSEADAVLTPPRGPTAANRQFHHVVGAQ